MAHTTNRIYIDTSVTPNVGVSIGDIQAVIGSSRNDIGGLIVNGNINKWAKYKPYRSSVLATTDAQRRAAFFGLSISVFNALGTPSNQNTFLGKLVNDELMWTYLRPRGLSYNEWFRFLDFDGYYKDAVCPVGDPVTTVYVQNNGQVQLAWDLLDNLDAGNLTLADIYVGETPLSDYYLGVLLYKSGSNYRLVTSDNTLGTGDVQITISNFPQSDIGMWQAYPFFSSVPIAYNGTTGTGSYLSAGWDTSHVAINIHLSSQSLSFYAFGVWQDSSHNAIDVDWYAYNDVSTARTVTPTLVLMYAAEGVQPSAGSMAAQVSLGSVTVPAASGGVPGEASGHTTISRPSQITYDDYIWWLGIAVTGFTTIYEQIEEPESEEGE